MNRADFPAAIGLLGEEVVEDAANGEAWLHLGVCYLETRQPDLALEALERAVRAWPRVLELEPDCDFACFGRVKAPNDGPAPASGGSL